MKIILVRNQNDYDALKFEDQGFDLADIWQRLKDGETIISTDGEDYEFSCEAMEFKAVDPAFVQFITSDIQDEDHAKHTNFYVVKETK